VPAINEPTSLQLFGTSDYATGDISTMYTGITAAQVIRASDTKQQSYKGIRTYRDINYKRWKKKMTAVLDVHKKMMEKKPNPKWQIITVIQSFWLNLYFSLDLLEANLILKTSFSFSEGFFQWRFIYAIRQ